MVASTQVAATIAGLPAHLQQHIGKEAFKEFSGGVTSSFPIISYRGRTWRIRKGGEEQAYLNMDGEAIQSIEVVLLRSNPLPSKVFYEEKFSEGDQSPPRCWSADGVKPDAGVTDPIHPVCASCPNNAWGSKITENDKKTRACSDVRRCAVSFKHQLEEVETGAREAKDVDVLLLRIPPATLNPLKDYVEKILEPKGVPPYVLVTKIGFDVEVAYPKLTFKGLRFLTAVEVELAVSLREGEDARRILNESLENNDAAGTTSGQDDVSGAAATAPAEATAKAPAASPKLQPVEEELFSVPVEDIAPAPPRAAAVEAEAAQVVEAVPDAIAPPPEPIALPPAAVVTTPAAVATPAPEPAKKPQEPTSTAATDTDFDKMLDDILS